MIVKGFNDLPKEAIDIRTEVFMKEQGFKDEFDEIDKESFHIIIFNDNQSIVTCRVYYSEKNNSYMIGRIAVRKEYRGKGFGAMVVKEAEKYIRKNDGKKAMLFAQKRANEFYAKLGYAPNGYEADDEGCPHIMMEKNF